jgi:hypothetical protein
MSTASLPTSFDDLSKADQQAVAAQLAHVVTEMESRYGANRHQGMFAGYSDVIRLPDSGHELFVDITALECTAVIVEPGQDGVSPLSRRRQSFIRLLQPLVTPERMGGPLPTPEQREDWLWAAGHHAQIAHLGY